MSKTLEKKIAELKASMWAADHHYVDRTLEVCRAHYEAEIAALRKAYDAALAEIRDRDKLIATLRKCVAITDFKLTGTER
jgi:hypothetical protein